MGVGRGVGIRVARCQFELRVREGARALDPAARYALVVMLKELRAMACENAGESYRRAKWMQFTYWKLIAVYAGHFARLVRRG